MSNTVELEDGGQVEVDEPSTDELPAQDGPQDDMEDSDDAA